VQRQTRHSRLADGLDNHGIMSEVATRAAMSLRHHRCKKARLSGLGPDIAIHETLGLVPLVSGRNLFGKEPLRLACKHPVVFRIQPEPGIGVADSMLSFSP
jgi:hypothetical protein